MVLNQQIRKRKASGGKYKLTQRKKKYSLGRDPTLTKVGEKTIRKVRVRGGSEKLRLISGNMANVLDQDSSTYITTEEFAELVYDINKYNGNMLIDEIRAVRRVVR